MGSNCQITSPSVFCQGVHSKVDIRTFRESSLGFNAYLSRKLGLLTDNGSVPVDYYDSVVYKDNFAILNKYRAKIPYVRILPTPKQNKGKRPRRPAFATRIGSAVLPPQPPPADVEEEEEPLLLPTPPTETPLQLPTPPEATPFKPPNQRKEEKGKRLLPSSVMMTRSRRQQRGTGLRRTMLRRHWITY